jgi:hypothetical protein
MHVSSTELAQILGISRQRVNELGRQQKITREPDGLWDLDKVRAQLGHTLDPQQTSRVRTPQSRTQPEPDPDLPPGAGANAHDLFNRARAAKEIAIAKEKQLELKKREGQLVEEADVERIRTKELTMFKNRLLLVPDKLATRVAASSDVAECRELIETELFGLLNDLSEAAIDDVA